MLFVERFGVAVKMSWVLVGFCALVLPVGAVLRLFHGYYDPHLHVNNQLYH